MYNPGFLVPLLFTKDEPNGAASKDVETSVRTAAPSYTPAKETPLTQVVEHPVQTDTKECVLSVRNWDDPKDGLEMVVRPLMHPCIIRKG